MKKHIITASLERLALWYDYTIVCDNIEIKSDNKLLLTNPIEYTREELLKKYNGATRITSWTHTFTEKHEPAMAVIIKE